MGKVSAIAPIFIINNSSEGVIGTVKSYANVESYIASKVIDIVEFILMPDRGYYSSANKIFIPLNPGATLFQLHVALNKSRQERKCFFEDGGVYTITTLLENPYCVQ